MNEKTPDILETTQRMIERFGDDALREIELRIHELKGYNETEATDFWLKVRDKFLELRNRKSDQK